MIQNEINTRYKVQDQGELRWDCSSCTRAPIQLIQASAGFQKWRSASTSGWSNSVICIKQYTGHYTTVFVLRRELSQSKLDFSTAIQHSGIVAWWTELWPWCHSITYFPMSNVGPGNNSWDRHTQGFQLNSFNLISHDIGSQNAKAAHTDCKSKTMTAVCLHILRWQYTNSLG